MYNKNKIGDIGIKYLWLGLYKLIKLNNLDLYLRLKILVLLRNNIN